MKAMRDVWGDTLVALGKANPNVLVLDADLANSTKADKFAKACPERFLQMGIAEQNFIGAAVGLASVGYIPWLSTFAIFFTHRAVDPIRMLVAQTHANVKLGAAYAGVLTGLTGKTHQDVEDLAIMRAMPGMTIIAPIDSRECEAAMRWATEYEGPVYLRLARDVCPDVFEAGYEFKLGKTYLLKGGKDVLLVSTGPQSQRCLEAANLLDQQEVSAGVLHLPSIKPLDREELIKACEPFKTIVTVEEHSVHGGLGGLVCEVLSGQSPKRVNRLGLQDRWGESAPNEYLLDLFELSPVPLCARVKSIVHSAT
jgi:transketolase